MEPNNICKVPKERPGGREDGHDYSVYQHGLDRKPESPLNEMDDHSSRTASDVGEEVKDGIEDCAELDRLVLDDTECVSCCSEDFFGVSSKLTRSVRRQ